MIGRRAGRLVEGDVMADTAAYTYGGAYVKADLKGASQFCVWMKSNPLRGPSQLNSYVQAKQKHLYAVRAQQLRAGIHAVRIFPGQKTRVKQKNKCPRTSTLQPEEYDERHEKHVARINDVGIMIYVGK